jgi:hypothetical protein
VASVAATLMPGCLACGRCSGGGRPADCRVGGGGAAVLVAALAACFCLPVAVLANGSATADCFNATHPVV